MTAFADANPVQRALRGLVASGPGARVFAPIHDRLDTWAYRLTGGRHTVSSLLAGLPVVMLTTTGRRSGRPHTVPLLGLPTPEGIAVIASNYGRRNHPAWYHNLRADPNVELEVGGIRRPCRAVEVEGERREAIWRQGLAIYPGWSQYAARANRRLRVIVLEPADQQHAADARAAD